MSDLEKRQRKMMAQAAKQQKMQQGERRHRPRPRVETEPVEKLFCDRCLAALDDRDCPRCAGNNRAPGFCRRCLDVHPALQTCTPWALATGSDRVRPQTWRA